VEAAGEVGRRVDHGAEALGAGVALGVGRRAAAVAVEDLEVVAVPLGDRLLDLGVGDHDPVVGLAVRRRGRLDADVEALLEHLALDGSVEVEALADGACGRQHLVGAQVQMHRTRLGGDR
jgi:hypothetical protein